MEVRESCVIVGGRPLKFKRRNVSFRLNAFLRLAKVQFPEPRIKDELPRYVIRYFDLTAKRREIQFQSTDYLLRFCTVQRASPNNS